MTYNYIIISTFFLAVNKLHFENTDTQLMMTLGTYDTFLLKHFPSKLFRLVRMCYSDDVENRQICMGPGYKQERP